MNSHSFSRHHHLPSAQVAGATVVLLIEDVVMNTNDETNGPPVVWRSPPSDHRRTDRVPPVDAALDDGDIFALMPPPQQTIWPRVWQGL